MRTVKEWIGRNDNASPPPPRVQIRVFDLFNGICAICELPCEGKRRPEYDHTVALCNGGENRESNLRLLCVPCHKLKTKADVAEKKINNRVRAKHLGIRKPSRFPGSRDSGWKKKIDGTVVRR